MDDHTYFLLEKVDHDIGRAYLVLEQLHLHVAELPPNRTSEAWRWIRVAYCELERHYRIRAALLEPNSGTLLH
jgi:hypothetical protein